MASESLITSVAPRTLSQILAIPDLAVSWKWGIQLPSNIPTPKSDFGNVTEDSGLIGVDAVDRFLDRYSLTDTAKKAKNYLKNRTGIVNLTTDPIDTSDICLRASSVTCPLESITSTTTRTQARLRNFPDQITTDSVRITFYEDYNFTVLTYLDRWKRSIVNEYGVFRLPEGDDGYARDIIAYLFDTTGLLRGTVTFSSCYPEQISGLDLNSESNAIQISCQFSTQKITWQPYSNTNLTTTFNALKTTTSNFGNIKDSAKELLNNTIKDSI